MAGKGYVVQVRDGFYGWRKVRGAEGGPWMRASRAQSVADARMRESGVQHRVVSA